MQSYRQSSVHDWAQIQIQADLARKAARTIKPGPKPGSQRIRIDPATVKDAAFYVPVDLDLEKLLGPRLKWYGAYLLNLIHMRQAWWRADADGWVRLKARYLLRVIPTKDFKPLKEALVKAGVLEVNPTECWGRCNGYRITEPFRKTYRVVCPDAMINRKIYVAYNDGIGLLPVHRWLEGKLAQLSFDLDAARAILATMKPKRKRRQERLTPAEYRQRLAHQAEMLANGDVWLVADAYGRVHTPITSLPRELRKCLKVNGSPLVNIDLRNSQPLFLGLMAVEWSKGSKYVKSRLRSRKFPKPAAGTKFAPKVYQAANQQLINRPSTTQTVLPLITEPKPNEANDLRNSPAATVLPEDLVRFLRNCESGQFYESLLTEEERKVKRSRDRLKRRFYVVLFGRNRLKRHRWPNVLRERFETEYPTVAAVLADLKRKNYRHSSHLLQNIEATAFIYRIGNRIRAERPDMPLFTIHDSLMTTPENVPYVRTIIASEFANFGIVPSLKEDN
jgi:hypothetical protein